MTARAQFLTVFGLIVLIITIGCGGSGGGRANLSPAPAQPSSTAVSVAIARGPAHLGAAETYQFTATVTNASDTTVAWGISGCAAGCGTISNDGLYTAPSFVASAETVTITATPRADPAKSASVSLLLMPVSVSLTPNTPTNVLPGATRDITATVDHDPQNAGVLWSLSGPGCSGDGCGTLSSVTGTSAVYRAPNAEPSPNTVTLATVSVTDPHQEARVTFTVSATPFLMEGKYAFLINGYERGELEAIAGHFAADGNGHLTGVWDANRGSGAEPARPITGTYSIQPDGHGSMTIQAGTETWTYILSLDPSGAVGRFAESAGPLDFSASSGYMVRQDESAFNLSSVDGDRVIALYGEATYSHAAALGQFTSAAAGNLNGVIDLCWEIDRNVAKFPNTVALAGTFGAPDAGTGRGTASLIVTGSATTTYHFAYYIVSGDQLLLVQTDARGFLSGLLIPTLSGGVWHQNNAGAFANASLNAPLVFHDTNGVFCDWDECPMVRVGQMTPNAFGALTLTYDENLSGIIKSNVSANTTYSVSGNGRVTWGAPESTVAYLVDHNRGYFMTMDGDGAGFGAFEPQTGGPFSTQSIAGTYRLNTGPPATWSEPLENDAGWMTLANDGIGTATLYVNSGTGATPFPLTVTATVAADGRGTLVAIPIQPAAARNIVFWTISPDRLVALSTINWGDTKPVLFFVERTGN